MIDIIKRNIKTMDSKSRYQVLVSADKDTGSVDAVFVPGVARQTVEPESKVF